MQANLISQQITKFRKAAGLTQEELGKAVGVSTQAVSRWECGGAPDISLLPVIADALGVDINALFGCEGGAPADINAALLQWERTVPKDRKFWDLCALPWKIVGRLPAKDGLPEILPYLENCEADRSADKRCILYSSVICDGGIYLGVNAQDMAFSAIFPEPEKGYAAYFSDHDTYRGLFGVLAEPGCLELLCCIMHHQRMFIAPEALALRLGEDTERIRQIMQRLEQLRVLESTEVILRDAPQRVYWMRTEEAFVPLLYMARCFMELGEMSYLSDNNRTGPLL